MTEEVDHEWTLFFLYVFSDPRVTFVTNEGWLHADVLKPIPLELITTGIFGANFLIWLQFSQAFCVMCFLSKKDPAESTFFTNSKIVYEVAFKHHHTHGETFFYRIYGISFLHSCLSCIEICCSSLYLCLLL
jgi:hypothetical protein